MSQTVLITGTSAGFGKLMATSLLKNGHPGYCDHAGR